MATTSPSARKVSPTHAANNRFGAPGATWRPDRGLGPDYTRFVDILSRLAPDVQMSDSIGPAVKFGIEYALSREWSLFASVAALKVKTDLVATGATVLTTTIDINPVVYSLGAAYKF